MLISRKNTVHTFNDSPKTYLMYSRWYFGDCYDSVIGVRWNGHVFSTYLTWTNCKNNSTIDWMPLFTHEIKRQENATYWKQNQQQCQKTTNQTAVKTCFYLLFIYYKRDCCCFCFFLYWSYLCISWGSDFYRWN